MKVLMELEGHEVSRRLLSEKGMMSVDRALMEELQKLHPDMMFYDPVCDSYHPVSAKQSILEGLMCGDGYRSDAYCGRQGYPSAHQII